jgi:hypothetical protein
MMDSFRLCLVLGPLAIYLLLLGAINLSRRPFLVTGARDLAALGVAVAGMVVVGPVELLLPEDAIHVYQSYVWLLLVVMYSLCLSLMVLLARPRLTIYNMSLDEIRPVLAEAVAGLDADALWAGNSLALPNLKVELHVETSPVMRNVSLVANGDEQSYAGWRQLELSLAARLGPVKAAPNPVGLVLALAALFMFVALGWQLVAHPKAVAQGFREMLRL